MCLAKNQPCCARSRVRQLVVEVHEDGAGRVVAAQRLLATQAGFDGCVVDQDELLHGSSIHMIYCARHREKQAEEGPG